MAVNRYYSSNAVDTTLVTGIDASATEVVLASTSGMPQSYPFTLALDYDTASEELINVVGVGTVANSYKVGSTVGVASITGRGVDGNAATSHTAGAPVKHVISARDIREAQVHINASTKYTVTNGATTYDVDLHGIASGEGSVVGTTKTQTLTNKSISGASNTITSIAQSSVTNLTSDLALKAPLAGPTFTGTVVLPSTTSIGNVSSSEIGVLDGLTSSTAELNILDGVTATAAELNVLDGITASTAELNYVDGVTSNIQTQFNNLVTVPTGVISQFAGDATDVPTGWLLCDGSTFSSSTYPALATLVADKYGTHSGSNYYLPNLKGRIPVGRDSTQSEFDTLGETGGAKTVTLTQGQLPSFSHEIQMSAGGGDGTTYVRGSSGGYSTSLTYGHGSGEAHPNLQPYIVLNYIIKH
jgi:microcystin-dependent protein